MAAALLCVLALVAAGLPLSLGESCKGNASCATYLVVAPLRLKPHSHYRVEVTALGSERPTHVTLELLGDGDGHRDGDYRVLNTTSVVVEPNTTRTATLEVGDASPGTYHLRARGTGGIEFTNTTLLQYSPRSVHGLIQTDRAVYRPGQNVRLRVLVLNSILAPSTAGPLTVYIKDGAGHRVRQWERPELQAGIFTAEMPLSEAPVLGYWTVTAAVGDRTFSRTFQVVEELLPAFEVSVKEAEPAILRSGKLLVAVNARYTYGQPVRGRATLTAYKDGYNAGPRKQRATISKNVPIVGKTIVEVDASELRLSNTERYDQQVRVDVEVVEALTDRQVNSTTRITVHRDRYVMELVRDTDNSFTPGTNLTATVKVALHDGTPVHDESHPVTITLGYDGFIECSTSMQRHLPVNGLIQLELSAPPDANSIEFQAQYLDQKQSLGSFYKRWESSNTPESTLPSLSLAQLTKNPKVGDHIELNVTVAAPWFAWLVMGREEMEASGSEAPSSGKARREAKVRFLATPAMAPTARVLVYAVGAGGELHAETIDIQVNGVLRNFVNISVSPNRTEPGNAVELRLQAQPDSYLGVVAVDQRALLEHPHGGDFTEDDVMTELQSGQSSYYGYYGAPHGLYQFTQSGTTLITNGKVPGFGYGIALHMGAAGVNADKLLATQEAFAPGAPRPEASKAAVAAASAPRVRRHFPETWIWEGLQSGPDGTVNVTRTAPDSITSWVVTAFSLSARHGLGLSAVPAKVTVFRPFFVSVNLPYSVIRGEAVAVNAIVHNYMDQDVTAEVALESTGDFVFADDLNEVTETKSPKRRTRSVTVPSAGSAAASFLIAPRRLGRIVVRAAATSAQAADAIESPLLVKAEGETQYKNKAYIVDLRNKSSFDTLVTLNIPDNIVPESERIELSAIGDILGPSIENLDKLIRIPYGCGEQNMLNFVPNIVVLNYLNKTRQLREDVSRKARKLMEKGYQQELTYRHGDGSFSAFGDRDLNGSTWLTAFVAKSFLSAAGHINIDEGVIQEALQWLSLHQAADGHFPEVGTVSHTAMQGGAGRGLPLTAYVLTAFLLNPKIKEQYKPTVDKTLDFLAANSEALEGPYATAITAYALHLAQHPAKEAAFRLLESKANTAGDRKWWGEAQGSSQDVEMTSYALLTFLERGLVAESIPIMHWLIAQRNQKGGFTSTQDTVVGLQALAALGEKISTAPGNMLLNFSYPVPGGRNSSNISVTADSAMTLQTTEVPRTVREVSVHAEGSGFALLQASYRYNVNDSAEQPLFFIQPELDGGSGAMKLRVCAGFVAGSHGNRSNMAVMEVALPSGFAVDKEALAALPGSEGVTRVETKESDTKVILYFDKMEPSKLCPRLSAYRSHGVALQKPVPISVYDYYDQTRRARVFYQPPAASLCDICEGDDCKRNDCAAAS